MQVYTETSIQATLVRWNQEISKVVRGKGVLFGGVQFGIGERKERQSVSVEKVQCVNSG